ncbi:exodeoxyribonuclease VII small subunit [Prosthecochloris sp. HL-130-GSB]|jgi:exodeoxyribonuclease VII small subunit|uniref:exodeoxyribonuclease VII small subunit n=1 Tax=Prosthecochloris sp. HL-130-GSB TaxID=1974213 RepID=UPI000A1C115D|nr:exodeoxyribonuclease VII small subunit [Prosthecochloris sp. HL-130-GSB]ARM31623.1 exodeoxyribonuclease VII small subunit [Prosthecochloris sp. HL-130-GSB]MBO8092930.1 exodeoxyribonuclease VII small subunit [Prosthecochloris sp.]
MSQKKQSIEELIRRLEELTREIEHPDTGVEQSIKLYEEGLRLAELCKKRLTEARQKLETIDTSATRLPAGDNPSDTGTPQSSDLFGSMS